MSEKEAIVRRKKGGNSPMAINDSIIPYGDDEMSHPIVKANCKLCNSEFRDEAENMFLQQRKPNFNVILLFLKGQGEEISFQAVKNHLVNHYKAHFRKEFLTEYSDDVKRWIDNQPNKVNAIRQRIAILEKEMIEIASEGGSLQLEDRRKNAEILKKLAESILNHEAKLEEYEKQLEPVTVIINQLKIIINNEVKQIESSETKKVLISVLSKLQNSVDGLMVNNRE